jgi:hypothetical protein
MKLDRDACVNFGYDPYTIPTGALLGMAVVADCVEFPHPSAPPDPYGDFAPGRYGWLLQYPIKWFRPIPNVKGSLGLWTCNEDINIETGRAIITRGRTR